MRKPTRRFGSGAALALLLPLLLLASSLTYAVPRAVQAHRFRLDYRGTSGGLVLADLAVNEQGKSYDIKVRHGDFRFASLVRDSLLAGWTFTLPEEARARADEARVAVAVLFRQPQLLAVKPPQYDVPPVYEGPTVPPQPRRLREPAHPTQVTSDGVAVLSVTVDEAGGIVRAVPLFGGREFVDAVRGVLGEWDFAPGRQANQLVESGLLVVVYFPRPSL